MNFRNFLFIITLFLLSSCKNDAYNIGYNWAEHLCEIREFEVNGGKEADKLTAKEIVTIKGITESKNSDFDSYESGFRKFAEEQCSHKEYLLDQLMRSKVKREKIINGTY